MNKFEINQPTNTFERVVYFLRQIENGFSVLILIGLVIIPILEIIFRNFFNSGIPGGVIIVQHLTLWIGFAGAALAARHDRLLSFTLGSQFFGKKLSQRAKLLSGIVGTAVALGLAKASIDLVVVEMEYPRYMMTGLPVWLAEMIMPIGFIFIALRIFQHGTTSTREKLIVIAWIILIAVIAFFPSLSGTPLLWLAFLLLFLAIIAGAPIFIALGGAALILFWHNEIPIASIPAEIYRIVVSPVLPTIPLFTLAGYFLSEGGASKRLVNVFREWFGWLPGGEAIATILVCAFFTTFTGGSGVTILAFGALLFPLLVKEKYSAKFSLGLVTASGSLGLLFPPSLPIILYGVIAHVPVTDVFLGGIIPGFLFLIILSAWGVYNGSRSLRERKPFNLKRALWALKDAFYEALIPVIILVGIFGGLASLVETAAVAALYTFLVEVFIYKDLRLKKDVPTVMRECAVLVGGVLIILGVAMGLTSFLVDARVPMHTLNWVQMHIHSRIVFLLMLNLFLIITGCLMDIFSALVVIVPMITPLGAAFGIDPIHLGIIFLANLELGFLTPPVGMNLFLSSYRFNKPLSDVYRSALPPLIIMLLGVLLITYIPQLTMFIPGLFK